MLKTLKEQVFEANLELPKHDLVTYTWGNVSGIDREKGIFAIKPSGVSYEELKVEDIVLVDLEGNTVEGDMRPSSDTKTHLELYRTFNEIQGIVHTHSTWATARAQACKSIPCYGTTQADYFYGEIPCARELTQQEIEQAYEKNTGIVICDTVQQLCKEYQIDALAIPGILCSYHGPFTWGKDADNAVYNAVILEEVAKMATLAELVEKDIHQAPQYIIDKHYERKHGPHAYYGQV